MAGQSRQEAEAQRQLEQLQNFTKDLQSGKYNVLNRFQNYAEPFGYEDISKKLDEIFSGQENILKRNIAEDIAQQQQGAVSSLASRGITGGSVVNDTLSNIASNINKNKYNVLGQLGINEASSLSDLMKYVNQNKLNQTQLASNVDLSNMRNLLSGLSTGYGQQQNLLGALDSGTWLDDLFAGLGTAAQIASIPVSGGSSGVSLLGLLLGG